MFAWMPSCNVPLHVIAPWHRSSTCGAQKYLTLGQGLGVDRVYMSFEILLETKSKLASTAILMQAPERLCVFRFDVLPVMHSSDL